MFIRSLSFAAALALILSAAPWVARSAPPATAPADDATRVLADEVKTKGWIAYAARSAKGDWDIFLCRPDGSAIRNITATPDTNEAYPQFSRDGRHLLFRRLPKNESIDGNRYGAQGELIMADADGAHATSLGKSGVFPWACWSPDGTEIACLGLEGITIVDLATKRTVRKLDRKGFFQQLSWSPDGKWLGGVSNGFGEAWSIARMNLATGEANAVSNADCCTPDWFPDSAHLIFSNRMPGQKTNNGYGWTQLWRADGAGKERTLVYAEDNRHVYGGHISPDAKYVLFTGNMQEDGDPGSRGAPMSLLRLADAPAIRGPSPAVRALHPEAHNAPVLSLPVGWEPCWTFTEIPAPETQPASTQPATHSPAPR